MVDPHKLAVHLQALLLRIAAVDRGRRVVVVVFLVEDGLDGQSVLQGRLLVGSAQRDGGYGHDEARQLQGVDERVGLIDRRAEEAGAQSLGLGEVAERLAVE